MIGTNSAAFQAVIDAGHKVQEAEVMHALVHGVYIKQMRLDHVGWTAMQHKHTYDHSTLLATGSVLVRCGDQVQAFEAPTIIFIKAGEEHQIMATKPDTVCYCIHALKDGEDVDSLLAGE